jgi:putative peptidoglycan lipid II flippase
VTSSPDDPSHDAPGDPSPAEPDGSRGLDDIDHTDQLVPDSDEAALDEPPLTHWVAVEEPPTPPPTNPRADHAAGVTAGARDEAPTTARLARSSAVVAAGTGLSRATGLIRIAVLAYVLGAFTLSDAYNLANNTPNILYELLLGGVLSATLIPVFVDHVVHDDEESTSAVVTVVSAVLLAITVIAFLAAPLVIHVYALKLSPEEASAQAAVAVPLLRLFVPQIFFYGLTTLWTSALNARRVFAVPAFAPVLNNVVVICTLLAFRQAAGHSATLDSVAHDPALLVLLGLGTTAGIVAMTLVLWPALRRAGIRIRLRFDWRNPSLRVVARLSGWTIGYVISNQVALFVVLTLANGADRGDVTSYNYAFAFFQLPHGLFAVSIMTAFMPELAQAVTRHDLARYRTQFVLALRLLLLVVLPAAVGYVLLARPAVSVALERGAFGPHQVQVTASVLVAFAVGLPGFSSYLMTLQGFYALKDTRTPFLINVVENSVNIVIALLVVNHFGLTGLGAAYAAAYWVAAAIALAVLRRRVGSFEGTGLVAALARTVAAAAVMGVVVWGISRLVGGDHGTAALVRLAVAAVAGVGVYFGMLLLLGSDDVAGLVRRLRRRPAPSAP